MKKHLITAILFVGIATTAVSLARADWIWLHGLKIGNLYADRNSMVFSANQTNPCGGNLFIVKNDNENYKEMAALLFAAKLTDGTIGCNVDRCVGNEAIVSHCYINN